LPGRFTAILADRTGLEAIESDYPESLIAKLDTILMHPSALDRVLIGMPPGDVICDEPESTDASVDPTVIVDVELSRQLRIAQRHGDSALLAYGDVDRASLPQDWKSGFKKLVRDFETWLRSKRPAEHGRLRSEKEALEVRYPGDDISGFVGAVRDRYRDPKWQELLCTSPDMCAIGRWVNLIMWYGRKYVRSPLNDHNLGNDYDDAHYAFLSLYTENLWTRDKGLKSTVDNISGGEVRVSDDWRAFERTRRVR